jgi:NAD-dependent dihydropyrimidine dehydrogenase PreA subunit
MDKKEERKTMDAEKRDRGMLRVDINECKGCGLCIEACPPKVIHLSERLNHYGYRSATYAGKGCTGCGICFLACPEPGAITVLRLENRAAAAVAGLHNGMEGAIGCASN